MKGKKKGWEQHNLVLNSHFLFLFGSRFFWVLFLIDSFLDGRFASSSYSYQLHLFAFFVFSDLQSQFNSKKAGSGTGNWLMLEGGAEKQQLTCCADCSAKFEIEARSLPTGTCNSDSTTSTLPTWLQQYKDENKKLSSNDQVIIVSTFYISENILYLHNFKNSLFLFLCILFTLTGLCGSPRSLQKMELYLQFSPQTSPLI